ncbi:MAG: hypothetical protein JWQ90_4575 [Hydrocarboniphaga sp.]|uniref:DUF1631 family protein n=1 Tax=Hydrocarboniphaga sp. TaxID=2033016 RepID=UPI002625157B|nr:DUF1631 family protein [Hydrocarboniphaga sp.]MDB5972125.1 hypothetical protein [Hydrocarboniphaga sp.]
MHPPSDTRQPAGPQGTDPLVDELSAAAVDAHRQLLDALLSGVEGSASGTGRSADTSALPIELTRRLRLDRSRLQRRYLHEIGRRFHPQALSQPAGGGSERELQGYTRPPSEALEEQLALAALARRLRASPASQLQELEQKLRALVRRAALPIATTVYSPSTALECFRIALEALDIERPQRQLLFARYEQAAAAALGPLYEQALSILDRHAVAAVAAPIRHARLTIDDAMLAELHQVAAGGSQRADARLAAALLAIVGGIPPDEVETHPVLQRIALLGPLCTAWFEPLPPAARRDVERLRFTLIKIVLADPVFLLNAGHPQRSLLRDACEHPDEQRRQRACSRIEQVAMNADFVHDGLAQLAPLSAQQIDSCLDQRHQQDGTREETRLGDARRQVALALARATLAHARPQGLRLFLRAGWGPLLTQRLLKHGQPSVPWQDALDQLERLLNALSSEATRVRDFEHLLSAVSADLFEAGMRSERCERLQQALREAYYELRVEADAADSAVTVAVVNRTLPGNGALDLPEFIETDIAPQAAKHPLPDDEPDLELRPIRDETKGTRAP